MYKNVYNLLFIFVFYFHEDVLLHNMSIVSFIYSCDANVGLEIDENHLKGSLNEKIRLNFTSLW